MSGFLDKQMFIPSVYQAPSKWAQIDGNYRYFLGRKWAPGPRLLWVMLNPSTADANIDDPTIRRCISFSKIFGFGSLEVVNLYALRSTDPKLLAEHPDPVGPENDSQIRSAAARAHGVVCAWGATAAPNKINRAAAIIAMLEARGLLPECLGRTQDGSPRHPLYVPKTNVLVPFR